MSTQQMEGNRRLRILVVDDNHTAADALARVLRKGGDDVDAVYDGQSAIAQLERSAPDLVLTDLKMEPVDGIAVLQAARAQRPPVEVIVFTAYGAVDVAVRAMRMGARDFLTKPITVEQVAARLEKLRVGRDVALEDDQPFVAHAPSSKQLLETLQRAAAVPSPAWIEGEIGSGRVFAAEVMHRFGDPTRPFTLRDASSDGPWPEAGTVVIPNVDDLPDDVQRSLSRELQAVPPQVRVVATAGPDGRRRVAEGALRAELYYQLSVVVVQVPPLRQRQEDILPLFEQGLKSFADRYRRPVPEVSEAVRQRLTRHMWPGNIRELRNLAERTVVLGGDAADIDITEQPAPGLPNLEPGFSLSSYLETLEKRILVEALRKSAGDRAQAGRLLGVERNTLRYKLNKYGLLDR